ncbi:hypothetical protein CXG81DRAFT_17082 [Caulochytrium protostelioides]|uniref:Uncharacterized protein n=1 Tax=Caulochytrium protostelioides TaxID=1555241 RepID=A0A4P9XD02_9FUNG|nr:hypothetical protein CXG81DRAFT_17082 [Caulochytrium protostelioides]|eukprot:RKP03335.1 hypothetical protein CXG81DRAFT_17082 [Caulochytrium protostelioides]
MTAPESPDGTRDSGRAKQADPDENGGRRRSHGSPHVHGAHAGHADGAADKAPRHQEAADAVAEDDDATPATSFSHDMNDPSAAVDDTPSDPESSPAPAPLQLYPLPAAQPADRPADAAAAGAAGEGLSIPTPAAGMVARPQGPGGAASGDSDAGLSPLDSSMPARAPGAMNITHRGYTREGGDGDPAVPLSPSSALPPPPPPPPLLLQPESMHAQILALLVGPACANVMTSALRGLVARGVEADTRPAGPAADHVVVHPTGIGCHLLLVSRLLGFGILLLGSVLKLPQVAQVVAARSTVGLPMVPLICEGAGWTLAIAYNQRVGNAFTTWGEGLAILSCNMVILTVNILSDPTRKTSQRQRRLLGYALLYGFIASRFHHPDWVHVDTLATFWMAVAIVLFMTSNVLQIVINARYGHIGTLSPFMILMGGLCSFGRLLTTFIEIKDSVMRLQSVFSMLLASIAIYQLVAYRDSTARYLRSLAVANKKNRRADRDHGHDHNHEHEHEHDGPDGPDLFHAHDALMAQSVAIPLSARSSGTGAGHGSALSAVMSATTGFGAATPATGMQHYGTPMHGDHPLMADDSPLFHDTSRGDVEHHAGLIRSGSASAVMASGRPRLPLPPPPSPPPPPRSPYGAPLLGADPRPSPTLSAAGTMSPPPLLPPLAPTRFSPTLKPRLPRPAEVDHGRDGDYDVGHGEGGTDDPTWQPGREHHDPARAAHYALIDVEAPRRR